MSTDVNGGTPPSSSRRSFLAAVFVSPTEARPRAGWRVAAHGAMALYFIACCSLPLLFVPGVLTPGQITMPAMVASTIGGAIGITAATLLARRFLDRRSFRSLGFDLDRRTAADLIVGFLIPGAQLGLVLLLELALGWTRWEGWAWEFDSTASLAAGLGVSLLVFILVGYQEELLSRGYQLQNLVDGSGLKWALLLSSSIFALLHLGNPGTSWASTLGLVAAGYFLAFGWVRTRQLWLSIGLHIGWNFFEGTVFGFPVSGLDPFALARHSPTGPAWATGGAFGPEAGLLMLPAYAVGLILVLLYTRRRLPQTAGSSETTS